MAFKDPAVIMILFAVILLTTKLVNAKVPVLRFVNTPLLIVLLDALNVDDDILVDVIVGQSKLILT